ncbi:cell division protein ZapE [Nocardia sp. NPDC051832]|uniref:cell division protein ZapE n=1 Tax=Nocardia sp. NPDC051832 TaxID=3155673 RepID=UPI0034454AB5
MSLEMDADQQRALARLSELVDRHGRPLRRARGIYLHGRPGRGKTMVLDRFYGSVASDRKRRFHFHDFFARLHRAAHEFGSIDQGIDHLLGRARLVCFDEFHVHDIGDAMLIARLLDALFARHILLVVTSNYPPAGLLPNPLFHERFEPAIAKIVERLDVLAVDGEVDYRTRAPRDRTAGFGAGRYVVDQAASAASVVDVRIGAHTLRAIAVDGAAITVDFAALCGAATSAADYVELAGRFRCWTLCSVPPLREVPADWAMRFVNLVDVLYDADLALTVHARVPLPDLVAQVTAVPDLMRAHSRLGELSQNRAVPVGQSS